ncbi:MAG: hypothetical protein E6K53_07840 [Gammaproteobacteria bacterium]|nr:MAG: hypothetical protein E6K53_07840 [Gammaproteobacteria bacterium]
MDSALKQRLVGAAVLIALAVIFVPMFFSSTPPKQENTTIGLNIPPAPERNFETRNLAVDAPGKATPAPAIPKTDVAPADKVTTVTTAAPASNEAADKPASPAAENKPVATDTKPIATPLVLSKPAPAPPPAPAAQADGHFLIGLGVYTDDAHAKALVEKVKKLGYPAFAESTEYQGKPAMRVRVGPYADRAAAEGVRLKIKQAEDKVPSSVVDVGDKPASATDATPAATPAQAPVANRAGGFAVQVGAFKSEEEANKLRDRMRSGGVASFVEKGAVGDTTWWKVRAGPYADKPGADAALASIKQKFQINGMVTAQP